MTGPWRHLVSDNPLMERALRAFAIRKNFRNMPASTWIVFSLVALIYVVLIGLGVRYADSVEPSLFLYLMLTVLILVGATVLHNALAGEREKRTLDLLLVAPVTAKQIVAAKLVKVIVPTLVIVVICVIPTIVLQLVRQHLGVDYSTRTVSFWAALTMSVVITLSTVLMVTGSTLYISSLNRTTASALTATLGVLLFWFVIVPIFIGTIGVVSQDVSDALATYHPYVALTKAVGGDSNHWSVGLSFICSSLLHLGVGVAGLLLTTWKLERERKTGSTVNA